MKRITIIPFCAFLLFLSCGSKETTCDSCALIESGKDKLRKGDLKAKDDFNKVIEKNPKHCEATWGNVLNDTQLIIKDILDAFERINDKVKYIESANCVFVLDSYPIVVSDSTHIIFEMRLGKKWDKVSARVLGAISSAVLAGDDLLMSHDTKVDMGLFLDAMRKTSYSPGLVGTCRNLGTWLGSSGNDNFLGFNKDKERRKRFDRVDNRLAECFGEIAPIVQELEAKKWKQDDDVLGYLDENGNKVIDGGDEITLGVLSMKTDVQMIKLILGKYANGTGPIRLTIPKIIPAETIEKFVSLFVKLRDNFAAVDDPSVEHDPVTVDDLNQIIMPVGFSALPNAVSIDLANLFTGPEGKGVAKPIKDFLPLTYTDISSKLPAFLVEGETTDPVYAKYAFYKNADSTHFGGNTPLAMIKKDGIGPKNGFMDLMYFGLKDPAFNGAVNVNLGALPEEAAEGPDAFATPDQYSFNKALNYFINLVTGGI